MNSLFILFILLSFAACKPSMDYSLTESMSHENNNTLHLAIARPLAPETEALLRAITQGQSITLHQLDVGGVHINATITDEVKFTNNQMSDIYQSPSLMNLPHYNHDYGYDIYRGLPIGNRIFIFKKATQYIQQQTDSWTLMTWTSRSLLNDPQNGKYTASVEIMRHYLETKIYEPRLLESRLKLLDDVEFVAYFIPGYAGAKNALYSTNGTERVLGVIQIAGDVATLGLGSSVKIISRTAMVITLSAASTRIGVAANRYAQGTATHADGIDAFLATVEAGIGAISIVKIKLTGTKAFVSSADDAILLSKQLGRSSDDILKNGVSKRELEKLVGDIPELRRLKNTDNPADNLTTHGPSKTGFNLCRTFGLTNSIECDIMNNLRAGNKLLSKQTHMSHLRTFFKSHFSDEQSWLSLGFKKAGSVGKEDADAVVNGVRQIHAKGKLKYLAEIADPEYPEQGLYHWFQDEFGHLVRVRGADKTISTVYEVNHRNNQRVMKKIAELPLKTP